MRQERPVFQWALAITVITFSVLYFLKPFTIEHGQTLVGGLRVASYALWAGGLFWGLESLVRPAWDRRFGLVLPWYAIMITVFVLGIFFLKNAWQHFRFVSWEQLGLVTVRVLAITGVLGLVLAFAKKLLMPGASQKVHLLSADVNPEQLIITAGNLIALTHEKNYTTIHYLEDGVYHTRLLRGSLKYFASQLPGRMVQTHRAAIINTDFIQEVTGNSQGKTVYLRYIEHPLLVTRTHLKAFDQRLSARKPFLSAQY